MPDDFEDIFAELDAITAPKTRETIIRAPFPYPGGKSKSVLKILPLLPHSKSYIEPFGGSGAVLLSKPACKLDVFNDRYAGVVAFYRCIRNTAKYQRLIEAIDLSIYSREDFKWCKDTWENCEDDVERAFRWYYMISYSFASFGRNWGRATSGSGSLAGKIRNRLPEFDTLHARLKNVSVENQD